MRERTGAGYSLLEMLLVIALTALTLLVLVQVFLKSQALSRSGERITLATDLGMAVIERTRALSFDQVPGSSTFSTKAGEASVDGFPPLPYEPGADFDMVVSSTTLSPTLKSVSVKVEFNPGRDLVLETYVRP